MIKFSRLNKHTDYSATKQKSRHSMILSVPGGVYDGGRQFSTTITVPAGVYVEGVNITTSLSPGDNFPCSLFVYQDVNSGLILFIQCHQATNSTYRLLVTVGAPSGVSVSVPSFVAEAKLNLSISPF